MLRQVQLCRLLRGCATACTSLSHTTSIHRASIMWPRHCRHYNGDMYHPCGSCCFCNKCIEYMHRVYVCNKCANMLRILSIALCCTHP